jgi:hypothetical protein
MQSFYTRTKQQKRKHLIALSKKQKLEKLKKKIDNQQIDLNMACDRLTKIEKEV